MKNRKLVRAFQNFYQQFQRKPPSTVKEQSLWLLRSFIVTKKRPDWVNAGFVLPTVAMVSLVVVLLTVAILFRSFERSKNASNVRVNQAVLNAATPAIDRARAKIDKLFTDPTLPRATPSDSSLDNAFTKNLSNYTFGDETPLAVRYDINKNKTINANATSLEDKEVANTAWRFPVDTDNNGKYDSFTLYGVFFRSPSRSDDGKFNRARSPLEARTPPMDDGSLGGLCAAARGTSFSLIGDSGWYKSGGNLKKSFFVYATTVPITDKNPNKYGSNYETYKGNQGFSAIEFQQDQERVPVINNAVVYEDDLEITPGAGLSLNGRVFTNSNLLTATIWDPIRLYQVSSPKSCFYQAENSKIIVGGNLAYGRIFGSNRRSAVRVDLFKPGAEGTFAKIDDKTRSVNNSSADTAYNAQAYAQRINLQVERALQVTARPDDYSRDPQEVQENIKAKLEDSTREVEDVRREELEAYFKKRTRKVPFRDPVQEPTTVTLQGLGTDLLRGPDRWIYPFSLTNNSASYTGLNLQLNRLPATEPNKLKEVNKEEEKYLGDRIILGNNLPALWYDPQSKNFVGKETRQTVLPKSNGTTWTDYDDEETKYRYRNTQIQQLISLEGATKRNDFFEQKAAEPPKNPLDNVGGMRVVTGAGIYVDGVTFNRDPNPDNSLPVPGWDTNFVDPTNRDVNRVWVNSLNFAGLAPIITWPDSMPMGNPNDAASRGDLLMRATAVYHYKDNNGENQTPIACVSSYYDPTNSTTAQNNPTVRRFWSNPDAAPGGNGKSNNGITYTSYSGSRASAIARNRRQLDAQARLVFPNGRFANEPLRDAMLNVRTRQPLTMADNSAIDAAVCAIEILNGRIRPNASKVPHGTFYEKAFLDARQIKSIENTPNTADPDIDPTYTGTLEQRQPLEVRVTAIDLDQLRQKRIGSASPTREYLLPNSGIIYATRDDALLDMSDEPGTGQNNERIQTRNIGRRKLISPTDYKVDPTRRPNGIMLINGSRLDREANYRDEEKGLILATNVPAYIRGDFNLHAKGGSASQPVEEFQEDLRNKDGKIDWSKFYKRSRLDDNFACRKNDPRLPANKCTQGDSWRPATVIADAVTVLSDNFRYGFRNEGDYDLRNNAGNVSTVRRQLGFFENNFLTSANWFEENGIDRGFPKNQGSSYVNNFVTPIQRRVIFNEYLMEICTKIPVYTCTASDWSVDGDKAKATDQIGQSYDLDSTHTAGTTVDLAYDSNVNDQDPELRRFARRVAFARDANGNLILDDRDQPIPLGIDDTGNIQAFPRNSVAAQPAWVVGLPRILPNKYALWFRTTERTNALPEERDTNYGNERHLFYQTIDDGALTGNNPNEQPLLVPVLQIHMPDDIWQRNPGPDRDTLPTNINQRGDVRNRNWLQRADADGTTTNLIIAGGDTPASRTETNGGLENFIRYLEQWRPNPNGSQYNHNLSGSIIQYKRSAYASAPWQVLQAGGRSIFGNDYPLLYRTPTSGGRTPFYTPPSRQWGFDVGLLSQLPDLFAQTFTLPPTTQPNEFFREVSRDDQWVKTLLCAKTVNINRGQIQVTRNNAVSDNQRPTEFCKEKTGG
ncbi:MAG: hormogonium polysaccharide biosynthesis protein HpsA [Rivularia sp. (in: Bacteria)]|nr:hormogonium polysaccharide biosynthesis protein HpsA [Rivularia sp. MS3]